MPIYVTRHELSEANNRDNIGTPAFGAKDAPLMMIGRKAAVAKGRTFAQDYGVRPIFTRAAVSELLRTQQTARAMGFWRQKRYALLNEVLLDKSGPELRAMLDAKQLPPAALRAAEAVLNSPPAEKVWVTHGLLIAGMCYILGVHTFERFIPRFGEVRVLHI